MQTYTIEQSKLDNYNIKKTVLIKQIKMEYLVRTKKDFQIRKHFKWGLAKGWRDY